MTAIIGTSANLLTGTVDLGPVTNSYAGYLQSGGVAYNLVTPWQADSFEWWRYTTYGTNDKVLQGIWFRDFPSGDVLNIARGTTDLTSVLETTNGVTINNSSGGFTNEHVTITGISTATPGVVTAAGHGLSTGDRVIITKVVGTIASEVNNRSFVVTVLSSSTFALYDVYGNPITTVGTYTSGGQIDKEGPELGVVNAPVTYRLTLGSSIMGTDNDIIYFRCFKYNTYYNLGDIA